MANPGVGDSDVVAVHQLLSEVSVLHGAASSLLGDWDVLDGPTREVLRAMVARRAASTRSQVHGLTPAATRQVSATLRGLLTVADRIAKSPLTADDREACATLLAGMPARALSAALTALVRGAPVAI